MPTPNRTKHFCPDCSRENHIWKPGRCPSCCAFVENDYLKKALFNIRKTLKESFPDDPKTKRLLIMCDAAANWKDETRV